MHNEQKRSVAKHVLWPGATPCGRAFCAPKPSGVAPGHKGNVPPYFRCFCCASFAERFARNSSQLLQVVAETHSFRSRKAPRRRFAYRQLRGAEKEAALLAAWPRFPFYFVSRNRDAIRIDSRNSQPIRNKLLSKANVCAEWNNGFRQLKVKHTDQRALLDDAGFSNATRQRFRPNSSNRTDSRHATFEDVTAALGNTACVVAKSCSHEWPKRAWEDGCRD